MSFQTGRPQPEGARRRTGRHDLAQPIPAWPTPDTSGVPIAYIERVRAAGELVYVAPEDIGDRVNIAWPLAGSVWADLLGATAFVEFRLGCRPPRYALVRAET